MGNRIARGAGAVMIGAVTTLVGLPLAGAPSGATTLPACPIYAKLPTKPIAADVKAALTRYYAARHMTPVTVYNNRETILNVKTFSAGVHRCANLGGGKSGYVGVVPKTATAAVSVHVKHKAYAVTGAASTFATLAKMPRVGWKVVSDDTAP